MENELFRECLARVPESQRRAFNLSFGIAERLDGILRCKGMSCHDLALRMGKRDAEVSRWLTGRHNFSVRTITNIEAALGESIVALA